MIRDFHHREGDHIDLSRLDANGNSLAVEHFRFIGSKTFDQFYQKHPGSDAVLLRFDPRTHLLQGDSNHNGRTDAGDFEVKLVGVSHLTADDLILV